MNERIEELAKECWSWDHLSFNHEKFAELLVKECVSVIDQKARYYQTILTADEPFKIHSMAALKGVNGDLKRHFGVE